MKCALTNSILVITLAVFTVGGVYFALRTFFLTRELHQLTAQASLANNALLQMQGPTQALFNDVATFNKSNPSPELTKLLQPAKPVTK